ncbi:MAG: ATP-dependent 6-phosphofructokinase [Ignavibacteria bacterium]
MKIGVLTSGGDCPGLNAVIRAITRKGADLDYEVVGILNGWKGLFLQSYMPLNSKNVAGIVNRGGTILGTSRFSPFEEEKGELTLQNRINNAGFDALITIGGEGSMHIAQLAHNLGINVIGVPKTIDNDINGTDFTFGFDTAVQIATDAIDRLHTTAESHHRIMVLEVMGRHAGWIAMYSGMAGGADVIVIPEYKVTIKEIIEVLKNRYIKGKLFSIIVVAEGAEFLMEELNVNEEDKKFDEFGRARLGGISHYLANEIEKRSGFETRTTILGHVQRGGVPTAFDRMLGTRFGIYAVEMVEQKKFGRMCAIQGTKIIDIPISEAIGKLKTVDPEIYKAAQVFFK